MASASSPPVVRLQNVSKSFATRSGPFRALQDVSLDISAAQLVAVTGKSGSGKSTLLNIVAGIDRASTGSVEIAGRPLEGMTEAQLARFRGTHIGVVFQFFQLLPTLTILENVVLPMDFAGRHTGSERARRGRSLLERVGIADQAHKLPATLSGGQQQRAAIARALANEPQLIVADEPTGNLDSANAAAILGLFRELTRAGKTVLVVTHEREMARHVDREIVIADGAIVTRKEPFARAV